MIRRVVTHLLPWSMVLILIAGWSIDRATGAFANDADSLPDVLVMDQDDAAAKGWAGYEIDELRKRREAGGRPYLPFLNVPALRMGLYTLKANATDGQQPHELDETYYVVKGKGMFQAGEGKWAVQAGSVIYVKRNIDHKFYDITEDLDVLVFFSTAKE